MYHQVEASIGCGLTVHPPSRVFLALGLVGWSCDISPGLSRSLFDYVWKPKTVEDSIDAGVHPAVAELRRKEADKQRTVTDTGPKHKVLSMKKWAPHPKSWFMIVKNSTVTGHYQQQSLDMDINGRPQDGIPVDPKMVFLFNGC